jgi:hypothetical protein
MFVGVSITELIGWYYPVINFLWPLFWALSLTLFLLVPFIEWCSAFTDRREFKCWWSGWVFDVVWCGKFRGCREDVANDNFHSGGCMVMTIMGAICVFVWPLFVVGLSLIIPLLLIRAARDGGKLAAKVSKHIADKEAHNEGSSDSSSSS